MNFKSIDKSLLSIDTYSRVLQKYPHFDAIVGATDSIALAVHKYNSEHHMSKYQSPLRWHQNVDIFVIR
jgi:hypothetical protein